jgi:hypothetical protein
MTSTPPAPRRGRQQRKLLPPASADESYVDEAIGWTAAGLGLYFQFRSVRSLPSS